AGRLTPAGRGMGIALDETVQQMARMVADLVDVHVLEEGRRDFRPSEVDAFGVLRESVASFGGTATRKEIRLPRENADTALRLHTDAKALRQVIDNLISNAVKYSPARSEVRIDLRRLNGHCRMQVIDSGPGVKPEEREAIFGKYAAGSAQPTGGEK